MTVSLKRLIAFVALFAITLAGTPTSKANDGLKTERYGFVRTAQKLEVARQVPANLNQNPFRDKTVTAKITGVGIKIEKPSVPPANVARLLTTGQSSAASLASRAAIVTDHVVMDHPPVFSNKIGLLGGVVNIGRSARYLASDLYEVALDEMKIIAKAENAFANSWTAVATGYGVVPVKPATLHAIAFDDQNDAEQIFDDADSDMEIAPSRIPIQKASAVIRNITSGSIDSLPEAVELKRPGFGNISIFLMDAVDAEDSNHFGSENSCFGESLLIDQYIRVNLDDASKGERPSSLQLPALLIGGSPINSGDEANYGNRTLIASAKAIVKSIIHVVEPMFGVRQAILIPQRFSNSIYQLDELIFSFSNLNHYWEVCNIYD